MFDELLVRCFLDLDVKIALEFLITLLFIHLARSFEGWGRTSVADRHASARAEHLTESNAGNETDSLRTETTDDAYTDNTQEAEESTDFDEKTSGIESHQTLPKGGSAEQQTLTDEMVTDEEVAQSNKAYPFPTEVKPKARTQYSSTENESDIGDGTTQTFRRVGAGRFERTVPASSFYKKRNPRISSSDAAGILESQEHSDVRRWGGVIVRSGSGTSSIDHFPPSYDNITGVFYGTGPFFRGTRRIGPNGGTIAIAGCGIIVPRNAVIEEQGFSILCCYPEFPFKGKQWMAITPDIFMQPSGIRFAKPLAITVPNYFDPVEPTNLCEVKIQKMEESKEWIHYKNVKNAFAKKIVFTVDHFTGFRALVSRKQEGKLVKKLYYVGLIKRFTLRNNPEQHSLIFRICNNLPHDIEFIRAEMPEEHYENVIGPGVISIKWDQDLEVELSSQTMNVCVDPWASRFRFKNEELWLTDVLRQKTFKIHRNIEEIQELVNLKLTINVGCEERGRLSETMMSNFFWTEVSRGRRESTLIIDAALNAFDQNTV